jgi:hypothetical protein
MKNLVVELDLAAFSALKVTASSMSLLMRRDR